MQDAFWELGGLSAEHRTDNFSAAVNNLKGKDEWTENYKALLKHYELEASHNYPGNANENGDVEQSHHRFKKAIEQELILRGSKDFGSRVQYEEFLRGIIARRNAARKEKFLEEKTHLRPLPDHRLEDYRIESARVSRNSTIRLSHHVYSVDSRLMGEIVQVRIFSEHLEVWYAQQCQAQMARLRGENSSRINYRHVIDSLVRKPGAFENYRYKEDLFPAFLFRLSYDELKRNHPTKASGEYLRILYMAAYEGEDKVHEILRLLLEKGQSISASKVEALLKEASSVPDPCEVYIEEVSLSVYDELIGRDEEALI